MSCKNNQDMKIGIVVGDLAIAGGGERVASLLANYLAKQGYSVFIYHFGTNYVFPLSSDIKVVSCVGKFSSRILRKLFRSFKFWSQIRSDKPDVLISFGWQPSMYVAIAAKNSRVKTIMSERNNPMSEPSNGLLRFIRNHIYKQANCIVCQSTSALEYLGIRKSTVILNPLKDNLPSSHGARDKTIVNFCRLHEQKNLPLLINAFSIFCKKFPDYKLLIYGSGEEETNLKELISELQIDDKAYIFPFENNIHAVIVNSGMFVSSSNYEGLSNSMLEALAMGLPCVVTDCPIYGARMVVRSSENAILVPVNDLDSMVLAMNRIASDKEFADSLSNEAKRIREDLNEDAICNKWHYLIESVSRGSFEEYAERFKGNSVK